LQTSRLKSAPAGEVRLSRNWQSPSQQSKEFFSFQFFTPKDLSAAVSSGNTLGLEGRSQRAVFFDNLMGAPIIIIINSVVVVLAALLQ